MNKFMAITVFTKVVECNGFTAAADHLGLSTSAATKTVARLERDMKVRLFNRNTRRLSLTECGRDFYGRCSKILADLELAEKLARTSNEKAVGKVRIHLPLSFCRVTVIPMLNQLYKKYPELQLELHLADRQVDLIKEGFDLAVQVGDLPDSSSISRVLTKGPLITVDAPSYLEKHRAPKSPSDLSAHRCIISRWGPTWHFRQHDGKQLEIAVPETLSISSGDAVLEATAHGLGISHGTWWLYRKDLKAGRVKRILKEFDAEGPPISIIYPSSQHLAASVRAVVDFLVEIIKLN